MTYEGICRLRNFINDISCNSMVTSHKDYEEIQGLIEHLEKVYRDNPDTEVLGRCPFCNGEVELVSTNGGNPFSIFCPECHLEFGNEKDYHYHELVEAWNNRHIGHHILGKNVFYIPPYRNTVTKVGLVSALELTYKNRVHELMVKLSFPDEGKVMLFTPEEFECMTAFDHSTMFEKEARKEAFFKKHTNLDNMPWRDYLG